MFFKITSLAAILFLTQDEPKSSERPKQVHKPGQHFRDFSFKLSSDGHVALIVREEGKSSEKPIEKTYLADSIEDFTKQYPDVARNYRIDVLAEGEEWPPFGPEGLDKKFEDWKLKFDGRWFWDRSLAGEFDRWVNALPKSLQSDEMTQWFEEQRQLFEKFRQLRPTITPDHDGAPESSKSRPKLGVLLAPVGDTMAHQLGFQKVEGVVIAAVQDGSAADRCGLRTHDIVVKINGKSIPDTTFFQKEVLASPGRFELEILRRGKHEMIMIQVSK